MLIGCGYRTEIMLIGCGYRTEIILIGCGYSTEITNITKQTIHKSRSSHM